MIAHRVAVAQRANEPVGDADEWVPHPDEAGEPEVVDLRNGHTIEQHLRRRDRRV